VSYHIPSIQGGIRNFIPQNGIKYLSNEMFYLVLRNVMEISSCLSQTPDADRWIAQKFPTVTRGPYQWFSLWIWRHLVQHGGFPILWLFSFGL
jgi:hypothetical protein